jgi:hypothetical protein
VIPPPIDLVDWEQLEGKPTERNGHAKNGDGLFG